MTAESLLSREVRLLIVDGYRPPTTSCRHLTCAVEEAELVRPDVPAGDLDRLAGMCATPTAVAPHPTGGAVDLTWAYTTQAPHARYGPLSEHPDTGPPWQFRRDSPQPNT